MVNVDIVFQIVNHLANTYNERAKVTPETFNVYANDVSISMFYEEKALFEQTGQITENLRPFNSDPTPLIFDNNGQAFWPVRFEKATALYRKITINNDATLPDSMRFETVDITEIDKNNLADRLSSSIPGILPTYESPIYVVHSNYMQAYPAVSGVATLEYLKLPTETVWAYTTVDRQPVYDAANSVNFEWPGAVQAELCKRILKLYGIEIRDMELLTATNAI